MPDPEYIYTDAHMTEELSKALIEKYGHVPDLANMVPVDDEPSMTKEEAQALTEKYGPIESTVDFDMGDFGYDEGDPIEDSPEQDHSQCGPDAPCQNDD